MREIRGDDEVPPLLSTRPLTKADLRRGEFRTDGGRATFGLPRQYETPVAGTTGVLSGVDDSLAYIGVPTLHDQGITGSNVIAVTLDTGACGDSIEASRQLDGQDFTGDDDPWTPYAPHGGMTTGILAGDETTPGLTVGVLPESQVFPIKSTLASSELILAQDTIVNLAETTGKPVIVNNSWGFEECAGLCDHPVTRAIGNASNHRRVMQVFAGGNQAETCGVACDGTKIGINGPNSLSNVVTVAASGYNGKPEQMQPYSSRGGDGTVSCGSEKPDISAPVFGEMPYGCGLTDLGNNGGTSAATPQAAGVVGLLADQFGPIQGGTARASLHAQALQFQQPAPFNGCSGFGNVQASTVTEAPVLSPQTSGFADEFSIVTGGIFAGVLGAALHRAIYGT